MPPAVIAAGIGAAGTLIGANQQRQAAKKIGNAQDRLYGDQANLMEQLSPYAVANYRRAGQALDPAIAHYRAIASGDRPEVMSALAPELASIGNKYSSIIGASRELTPRSGTTGAYNTDLAFRAGDEQQALINNERNSAYGNLGKLAGVAGEIGSGAAGNASRAGADAGSLFNPEMLKMLGGGGGASPYGDFAKSLFGEGGIFKYGPGGWYMGGQPGPG